MDERRTWTKMRLDLLHRIHAMRVGGPTADGRNHFNGSLSNEQWIAIQDILTKSDAELLADLGATEAAVCGGCGEMGSGPHVIGDQCGLCSAVYVRAWVVLDQKLT